MAGSPDSPPPQNRFRPASRPGARTVLFFVLLLGALAVATPLAAGRALKRIAAALHHGLETPAQARERVLGAPYVRAIAAIRAAVPPNGAYALAEGGDPADGGAFWVRYELAPRKALDLGQLDQLPPRRELQQRLPAEVEWVVVANGRTGPPALHSRTDFLRRPGGREPLAP